MRLKVLLPQEASLSQWKKKIKQGLSWGRGMKGPGNEVAKTYLVTQPRVNTA